MNIAADLKRAPKWALIGTGGILAGSVAIKLYKGRATDGTAQGAGDGTPAGDDTTGTGVPTTGGGTGVIVPPTVVTTPQSDSGFAAGLEFLQGAFADLSALVGTVVTGDQQNMANLVGANTQLGTTALDTLAAAGAAPQPVQVNPTPVVVQIPVAPAATTGPPKGVARCPSSYPNHNAQRGVVSAKSCYKCERNGDKDKSKYPWVHRYQNGEGVKVTTC